MKKHPVDDLFKRKLTDWDKKPSENAWLKIQEKAEARRRPAVWIWYAAASIAIGLMAGYFVWQNNQNVLIHSGIDQKAIANISEKKKVAESGKEIPDEQGNVENPVATENEVPVKPQEQVANTEKRLAQVKQPVEKQEAEQIQLSIAEETAPPIENSFVPVNATQTTELAIAKPARNADYLPDSQIQKVEQAVKIVVAVESADDQMEEKPKTSRFSRVFRQLKNARAGERVDWDEVGFNPKTLVARVDDRLHSREEKESEKNQNPKERRKL